MTRYKFYSNRNKAVRVYISFVNDIYESLVSGKHIQNTILKHFLFIFYRLFLRKSWYMLTKKGNLGCWIDRALWWVISLN